MGALQMTIDLNFITQSMIAVGSMLTATMISGKTNKIRKIGFTVALLIQPAWMYTTFVHEQWAMFAVTFYYTYRNYCGWKNNKVVSYD
jgi:hypothetical protein